jgi:hypothetical protein
VAGIAGVIGGTPECGQHNAGKVHYLGLNTLCKYDVVSPVLLSVVPLNCRRFMALQNARNTILLNTWYVHNMFEAEN